MDEEKTTEHRSRDFERRQELLELIDRRTGLLLLVLAIAMIPLLIIPLLWDLSARLEFALFAFDGFIWAVFVIDIGVKIAVAPDRPRYLKEHWIEVIVAAVPFFRPLRVVRAVLFVLRAFFGARRLLGADFILIYAVGIVVVSAFMVNALETGDPESTIRSSPDALWWSVVTITTVGYGDMTPLTQTGRAIAFVLMVAGVGLFGGLTANLASLLVREDDPDKSAVLQLTGEVRALRDEIRQMREGSAPNGATVP